MGCDENDVASGLKLEGVAGLAQFGVGIFLSKHLDKGCFLPGNLVSLVRIPPLQGSVIRVLRGHYDVVPRLVPT